MNSKCGVQSKRRCKAMSLAFVLLDFQHAGIKRRASCTRRRVDMQQLNQETNQAKFAIISRADATTDYI